LERDTHRLAVPGQRLDLTDRQAAVHRPEAGRGGDQRAGLLRHHVQVVRHRIGVARPHGLGDLAVYQPGEGTRLNLHRLVAQLGGELRGTGEQEVADQDRDRVPPTGVGAWRPPAYLRLVHHVV